MNVKVEKMQKAINKMEQHKFVLYHIIGPISQQQLMNLQKQGCFDPSKNALGGQSDGYYFFTTNVGVQHHIENNKDAWGNDTDRNAYIVECEIDADTIKYPIWKLDYEAMQDFLFDMIYDAAHESLIKFDDVEIQYAEDRKLIVSYNGKFSRIKNFCANNHSGLIEKVSDFLYKNNTQFRKAYDKLLMDVFQGRGEHQELYAVKTLKAHKITKITKIETKADKAVKIDSQIDKFLSRYGRHRR